MNHNKYKELASKDLYEHVKASNYASNEEIFEVAHREKLHPVIESECPIHVTCIVEQGESKKTKLFFNLFYCGKHIGNPITLDYNICKNSFAIYTDINKLMEIGEKMIQEFISHCDLSDLNRELDGKCACKKFENIYKSCDECPHYRFRDGGPELEKNEENNCFGASFNYPQHLNYWDLERELRETYGPGSGSYNLYLKSRFTAVSELMEDLIKDEKSFKKMFLKKLFRRK